MKNVYQCNNQKRSHEKCISVQQPIDLFKCMYKLRNSYMGYHIYPQLTIWKVFVLSLVKSENGEDIPDEIIENRKVFILRTGNTFIFKIS